MNARLNLFGYENTADVRTKRWLVRFTRVAGLLVFLMEMRYLGNDSEETGSDAEIR